MSPTELSVDDIALLVEMRDGGWLRPMDLDGRDGSGHSAQLSRLVKQGLVERRSRSSHHTRPSYVYRITDLGLVRLRAGGGGTPNELRDGHD